VVISVPRRAVPLAVRRSRVKRLIRESLRAAALTPPPGQAFRFTVRSDAPRGLRMPEAKKLIEALIHETTRP
jgi:ribonuclease P protein component